MKTYTFTDKGFCEIIAHGARRIIEAGDWCCDGHCGAPDEFEKRAPPKDVMDKMHDIYAAASDYFENESEPPPVVDEDSCRIILKELQRELEWAQSQADHPLHHWVLRELPPVIEELERILQ